MGSNCFDEQQLHVLAVDDSVVERKFIEALLKNSSYKVTTAEDGLSALEYLGLTGDTKPTTVKTNYESIIGTYRGKKIIKKDAKVNMIITDYCMPGMTGYELMKKVKESSNFKEIPVIIMSSENVPTRIKKCLDDGAQDFILKPIQQSDVKRLKCHAQKFESPFNERLALGDKQQIFIGKDDTNIPINNQSPIFVSSKS